MAALSFDLKEILIQEVKVHPVLWNGEHKKYGDRFFTAAAWRSISRKMNISENFLRAKWKNLRDTFRNIIKKSEITNLEDYDGKWKYFHSMAFIKDEYEDDDESPIDFIVESDSENEISDQESQESSPTYYNFNENEYLNQSNMTDANTNDENYDGRSTCEENKAPSDNDEEIIQCIDRLENNGKTYVKKPEMIYTVVNDKSYESNDSDSSEQNDIPPKRQKTSDNHVNYDIMFLKSLAPYLKQLEPMRKLVMRSKIQDVLLKEIAEQNSLNSDS